MKHSVLNKGHFSLKSYKTVAGSGLGMVLALIVVAIIHHMDPNVEDGVLYYFSLFFAAIHILIYAYSFKKIR